MAEITVPKTPKSAFNPNRPPSGLLQAQIQHLEAAAGIPQNRMARQAPARTEGQAADYIARLTAQIYERAGAPIGPEIAMQQPPPPIAGTATPTSTTRHRTAAPAPSIKTAAKKPKTSGPAKRKTSRSKARKASASKRAKRAKRVVAKKLSSGPRRRRG
jgi:hypothetical protein